MVAVAPVEPAQGIGFCNAGLSGKFPCVFRAAFTHSGAELVVTGEGFGRVVAAQARAASWRTCAEYFRSQIAGAGGQDQGR